MCGLVILGTGMPVSGYNLENQLPFPSCCHRMLDLDSQIPGTLQPSHLDAIRVLWVLAPLHTL